MSVEIDFQIRCTIHDQQIRIIKFDMLFDTPPFVYKLQTDKCIINDGCTFENYVMEILAKK
jgi:hypothetical protein